MKWLCAVVWIAAAAQANAEVLPPATQPAPPPAQTLSQTRATLGDTAGGRYIPKPVLDILADSRIDPEVAYMLWQLSRRSVGDWTMAELSFVAQ
ncbi:MAG TPA: hypothetical protein VMU22_15740, partial [Rhizomicrobium sp.]|nr:hypothetical protein [Rhizomicrobium sp.]